MHFKALKSVQIIEELRHALLNVFRQQQQYALQYNKDAIGNKQQQQQRQQKP